MVPLLILAVVACIGIARLATGKAVFAMNRSHAIPLVLTGMILLMPIVLNTYSPDWNALLKQIPLIKSNSTLIRWFIIHIPFSCLGFGACLRANHGLDAYLRGDSRGRAGGRNQLDAGSKVIHSGAL